MIILTLLVIVIQKPVSDILIICFIILKTPTLYIYPHNKKTLIIVCGCLCENNFITGT